MAVADYMVADTRYVTAAQDRDFYAGIIGKNRVVLDVGNKLDYSIVSNTEIQVSDGVLVSGGGRLQIDAGDYESFAIPTGTSGVTAYFIIGYTVYSDGRDCETFVQSVASSSATIAEADMRAGASSSQISLYRVTQNGTTISSVTALFTQLSNLQTVTANMYPVGAVFKASQNVNPSTVLGGTWSRIATQETLSVSGSKVVTVSNGRAQMHTKAQIQSLFNEKYGFSPTLSAAVSSAQVSADGASTGDTYLDLGIVYSNGDISSNASLVEAGRGNDSADIFYALATVNGGLRVNYTYITHRTVYEWRRTA